MAPQDAYLLYHPTTRRTGRAVAQALGIESGTGLRGRDPEVVIRWGSQRRVRQGRRVINVRSALAVASDKFRTLEALAEAGIGVPEFTLERWRAVGWSQAGHTVLGRTRHGRAGNGIHVYGPGVAPEFGHELYTKLIPASNEYRVHVVGGEVIRCQQKQLTAGVAPGVIRSHESGYVFVGLQSFRLHQRRYDAAIEAVAALGLDFGAVDLLIGEDGETYVLEVNTAPGCSPMTLNAYATALGGMLNLAQWV